jgi:hypothetical protein
MARKPSLTHVQIMEIIEKKSQGATYSELMQIYKVTKPTLVKAITCNGAKEVVKIATEVINDKLYDADNYNAIVKEKMNEYVEHNVDYMNLEIKNKQELLQVHSSAIGAMPMLYNYIFKKLAQKDLPIDEFEKCLSAYSKIVRDMASISKLYDMGKSQNQLNVQLNNQNNFNSRGQRIYPEDEFTGDEDIEIIFCTSTEQARILKGEHDQES